MFAPEPGCVTLEDAVVLEQAKTEDARGILELLERSRLPLDGLMDHLATTIVARHDGRIVGSAALERNRPAGLLRSGAVAPPRHAPGPARGFRPLRRQRAPQGA